MKKTKLLKEELVSLEDFLGLVEAYEEISAIRMRKVKKTVLSRREFMQGLNTAFAYISYAYRVYKESLKKQGEGILNTNGRTVHVLLSSNTGLYGDIIQETFSKFMEDPKDKKTDIVIIGKMGKSLYDNQKEKKEYKYFEMSDSGVDEDRLAELLKEIIDYSDVIVYHGVFKSILSQEPEKTHVTGEVLELEKSLKTEESLNFLFEPSVGKIAEYFEKQILSLIFEQSVFESSLSKFASRMVSLDSAAENINKKLEKLDFSLKKSKHKELNSGIRANIVVGGLWK